MRGDLRAARRGKRHLLRGAAPGAEEFAARIERLTATHPWLVAESEER